MDNYHFCISIASYVYFVSTYRVMKNRSLLLSSLFILLTIYSYGQGHIIDFNAGDSYGSSSSKIVLSDNMGVLEADVNDAGPAWDSFKITFAQTVDLSDYPRISIVDRSNQDANIRIDFEDEDGNTTNGSPVTKGLYGNSENDTLKYDLTGKFEQSWPSRSTVDAAAIVSMNVFLIQDLIMR